MSFVLAFVAASLLLYAPGRAWLRAAFRSVPRPCGTLLFLEVLLATSLTSWVGLCLVEAQLYSLPLLLAIQAGIALVGWLVNRRYPPAGYDFGDLFGVLAVVVTLFWVSPPLDTRLLSGDSAGYLASGIHVARTGGLILEDPTIELLDVDTRRMLFPSVAADRGSPPYLRLLGSMVLRSLDGGEVLPAFHHLLSVWLAIISDLIGEARIQWTIVLFAGLTTWAVVLVAYQIAGAHAAWVAALVLLLQLPQHWYSRFLMPEVPAQFFLWGGIAALLTCEESAARSRAGWIAAGVALGIAGMMRLENTAFLAAAVAVAVITGVVRGRQLAWAIAAAAVVSVHTVFHTACFRTHYWGNLSSFFWEGHLPMAATLAAGLSLLLIAVLLRPRTLVGSSMVRVLIALLLALGLYADGSGGFEGSRLLIAYCGVLALTLSAFGFAWMLRNAASSATQQLLCLLVAIGLTQFLVAPHATPVPIWAIRRAVTLVVPALSLGLGVLVAAGYQRGRGVAFLASLLLVATLVTSLPALTSLRRTPLYSGASHHVRMMDHLIERDSVALIDPRLTGYGFAAQLWVTGNRPAYYVADNDHQRMLRLARGLRDRTLVWVGDGNAPLPAVPGLRLAPIGLYQFVLATPRLELGAKPLETVGTEVTLSVYRLTIAPESATPPEANLRGR